MATDPIGGTVPLLRWPRMSTSPLRVALLQPSFSAAATMVVSPAKVPEPRGAYRSSAVPSYQGPLSIAVSSSARATSSILVSRAKFQKVLDIVSARLGRAARSSANSRRRPTGADVAAAWDADAPPSGGENQSWALLCLWCSKCSTSGSMFPARLVWRQHPSRLHPASRYE
jgi:hypothetical protein